MVKLLLAFAFNHLLLFYPVILSKKLCERLRKHLIISILLFSNSPCIYRLVNYFKKEINMVRNLVSWFLIVVFAVAFCGLIAGCQDDKVKEPVKIEEPPVVKEAPVVKETPVVKEAPPVVKEAPPVVKVKPALPQVSIVTDMGEIVIELNPEKAPITVKNFLQYVNDGFYDGLIFHRVMPGFMIQGGGFTPELIEKPTRMTIKNEANNGLSNLRGTIAMARSKAANSATCQFFINVVNNAGIDYGKVITYPDGSVDTAGYAVFGKVVKGMDVVDKIVNVPTTTRTSKKGATLQRCPLMDSVVIAYIMALTASALVTQLQYWCPSPNFGPKPAWKEPSILLKGPVESKTIANRALTTLTPQVFSESDTASLSLDTRARKSVPQGWSSRSFSSPLLP